MVLISMVSKSLRVDSWDRGQLFDRPKSREYL
jgi:hypothetical protein